MDPVTYTFINKAGRFTPFDVTFALNVADKDDWRDASYRISTVQNGEQHEVKAVWINEVAWAIRKMILKHVSLDTLTRGPLTIMKNSDMYLVRIKPDMDMTRYTAIFYAPRREQIIESDTLEDLVESILYRIVRV